MRLEEEVRACAPGAFLGVPSAKKTNTGVTVHSLSRVVIRRLDWECVMSPLKVSLVAN